MNVENIQRVRDVIAALPRELFTMRHFHIEQGCGTAGCIAGWAQTVFGLKGYPPEDAQRVFGISDTDAEKLFWLDGYAPSSRYWSATPEQAVRVLDHFVATGEVKWSVAAPQAKPKAAQVES